MIHLTLVWTNECAVKQLSRSAFTSVYSNIEITYKIMNVWYSAWINYSILLWYFCYIPFQSYLPPTQSFGLNNRTVLRILEGQYHEIAGHLWSATSSETKLKLSLESAARWVHIEKHTKHHMFKLCSKVNWIVLCVWNARSKFLQFVFYFGFSFDSWVLGRGCT